MVGLLDKQLAKLKVDLMDDLRVCSTVVGKGVSMVVMMETQLDELLVVSKASMTAASKAVT